MYSGRLHAYCIWHKLDSLPANAQSTTGTQDRSLSGSPVAIKPVTPEIVVSRSRNHRFRHFENRSIDRGRGEKCYCVVLRWKKKLAHNSSASDSLQIFLLIVTLIGQRVAYHQSIEGDQLHIAAFTASEAIHNIRAVVAFGAEDKEVVK